MAPGRNAPCSCGSGKKFKHCCQGKALPTRAAEPTPAQINQLVALFNARRYAELEASAQSLLSQYAHFGFAWKILGASLKMQHKNALFAFQKAVELMPDDAESHFNLGVTQKDTGHLEHAITSYRNAVRLKPDYVAAHSNLANTLREYGQLEGALESYQFVFRLQPKHADTLFNMGNVLKTLGRLDEAAARYRDAISLQPTLIAAHNNLGATLKDLGQFTEAATSYRQLIALQPDSAEAYNNLGVILKEIGQYDSAVTSYARALQLKPDYAEAHNNLGNIYKDLGQIDEALSRYRSALQYKPDLLEPYTSLLFTLNYTASLSPTDCLKEAQTFGRIITRKATAPYSEWHCAAQPQRLRVGIVSGDLCNHPVGYFLESLLGQFNAEHIELIAYPNDLKIDALTTRIQPYFSAWKPLYNLSDSAAAQLIHNDAVHILLDLSGHTGKNRLPVFAWRPAPVQASWLGYFATTGVAEMNYLLADKMGVPETHRQHFSETIRYLPDTRLCFSPPQIELAVTALPALSQKHITFGCFQNLPKISDAVLSAWSTILAALPSARLRLQCKQLSDATVAAKFAERLQQHGIDPARVSLHGFTTRAAYLAAYAEVDFLLDTFPYPGGTTTCEALWMGVPTLTLAGDTLLARQGASLLSAADLDDWITEDAPEYIAQAIALSSDLDKLAALRANLREQVRNSPLFDATRFAHNLETELWAMWQDHTQAIPRSTQ